MTLEHLNWKIDTQGTTTYIGEPTHFVDTSGFMQVIPGTNVDFSSPLSKGLTFKRADSDASSDVIMTFAGYASTITLDRQGEIVDPQAFNETMTQFMEFPVLHLNHDFRGFSGGAPYGKITNYRIDEFGLYIEADIIDTPKGREVAALVEAGILRSMSIGFRILERVVSSEENVPTRITKLELIEISIVSSPANTDSLIEQAEAKGIEVKSLTIPPNTKVGNNEGVFSVLTTTDVDNRIKSSLEPVQNKFESADATVAELGKKVDAFNKFIVGFKNSAANGDKTNAELRELVEKSTGEFVTKLDELGKQIELVKASKPTGLGATTPILSSKDVLGRTNEELKRVLGDADARKGIELKRLNDDLMFLDAMMECGSRNNQGQYHHTSKAERVKGLKYFGKFESFLKGYDLTEDADWVPTDMSSNLEEIYRIERKVASLFGEFQMPAGSGSFDWPIQSTDSLAKLIGETTAIQTAAADSAAEHPTTDKVTFTAMKARARIQLSSEFTEDSAVAVLQWAQRQAGMSIVNSVEDATLNGDDNGTHRDGDIDTAGATHFAWAWDGLRFHANAKSTEIDGANAALTPAMLRNSRAGMGKYGVNPAELAFVFSPRTYLFSILANTTFSDLQTVDKYGAGATILTGEVLRFDGIPCIVSEYSRDVLNDAGVEDGITQDKAVTILVHRPSWLYGMKRATSVSVEKSIPHDMWTIYAFKRIAYQTFWTGTGENNVAATLDYLTV